MSELSQCLICGACCACYRVSFYWAEASDATPGGVPVELTEDLSPFYRCMKGSNSKTPRCIALEGEIGVNVRCTIHPLRPQVCRDTPAWFEPGDPEKCLNARRAYGMDTTVARDAAE